MGPNAAIEQSIGNGTMRFRAQFVARIPGDARYYLVAFLACLPTLDSLLDQLYTEFHLDVGGLSLPQLVRGLILVLVCVALWIQVAQGKVKNRLIVAAPIFLPIFLCVFALKEYVDTGAVSQTSIIAYLQIVYWTVLWMETAIVCIYKADAEKILLGIVIGCLFSSVSIYSGYLMGFGNSYDSDSIQASSGLFNTGKGVAGVLLVGAMAALYLGGRRQSRIMYTVLAAAFFGASFLTYARAAMVAAACVALWTLLWVIGSRPSRTEKRSVVRLLIALGMLSAIFLSTVGPHGIQSRWSDMSSDHGQAGSGRATFWTIAVSSYASSNWSDQALGVGYNGVLDLLERNYGARIHTHNDLLDMLLIGGVFGIIALGTIAASFFAHIRRLSTRSLAFCSACGVGLIWVCQGLLTGQLFGPDAMMTYAIAITALGATRSMLGGAAVGKEHHEG
jgi:hypothetical protein